MTTIEYVVFFFCYEYTVNCQTHLLEISPHTAEMKLELQKTCAASVDTLDQDNAMGIGLCN